MEDLIKELKELLTKHNAEIFVKQDDNDSFLYLQLIKGEESTDIDTGYRDLVINKHNLKF